MTHHPGRPGGAPTWPTRRLLDLLGISNPIVLSPMSRIGTVDLAAAVCEAGGLGSIGCALLSPAEVRHEASALRARTDRPFNLNFFSHQRAEPDAGSEERWRDRLGPMYRELGLDYDPSALRMAVDPFGEAMCSVVEEVRPAVVSFHIGLPSPQLVERVKAAGCLVMSSATTVEEARWLDAHGADVVIAQGAEAGGHRGTFLNAPFAGQLGTFALLPQIVDAVDVPVIAAGGVGDGRGIAAAFALGAAGVQMGTAYLACPESGISSLYREQLLNAPSGSTVLTNVLTGRVGRALRNRLIDEVGPISNSAPAFPGAMHATMQLAAAAQRNDSLDYTALWAGEAVPLARFLPARELTELLVHEARQRFAMFAAPSDSNA